MRARFASGFDRKGQAVTEKRAQDRHVGGSADTLFTAHIGPMTKALRGPRRRPQTQQVWLWWASRIL